MVPGRCQLKGQCRQARKVPDHCSSTTSRCDQGCRRTRDRHEKCDVVSRKHSFRKSLRLGQHGDAVPESPRPVDVMLQRERLIGSIREPRGSIAAYASSGQQQQIRREQPCPDEYGLPAAQIRFAGQAQPGCALDTVMRRHRSDGRRLNRSSHVDSISYFSSAKGGARRPSSSNHPHMTRAGEARCGRAHRRRARSNPARTRTAPPIHQIPATSPVRSSSGAPAA